MQRPKIGIVTTCMDRRPAQGMAVFTRELIKGLVKYKDELDITLVHRQKIPEDPIYKEFKEIVIPRVPLPKYSGFFSELFFFLTTRHKFDIYHYTHPRLLPSFLFTPAKKIVLMRYDGGLDTVPVKIEGVKEQVNNFWWPFIKRKVDAFIATSQFGVDGLINVKGISKEKVFLCYGGFDSIFKPPKDKQESQRYLKEKYNIDSPFIVASGRLDPHKNIHRLVQAYDILVKKYSLKLPLVVTGGVHLPDYSEKVLTLIKELGLDNKIKLIKVENFKEMPYFYKGAELLVFPSLYEGFGLPLIEAMACGIPTVVSRTTSLIEVGGDATKFFDPLSVENMAMAIKEVLDNKNNIRDNLVKAGFEQIKKFTWEKHVDGTVKLYKSLIENK